MDRAEPLPVGQIEVEICHSPAPRCVERVRLQLPAGSTLRQAVHLSGLAQRCPGTINEQALDAGIWGRPAAADAVLRDGDRIELYRPLQVDPKEARRQRYRAQGERGRPRHSRSAPRG
jgi:putative ubiquitin-RnfH superfamily antitoxin RatB of RatAB toxin-antitoxin module